MPSEVVSLGPFTGGLNHASDASAIADNELSEASNVIVDYDGSMVCRYPIKELPMWWNQAGSLVGSPDYYGRIHVIGNYFLGSTPWLIMSSPGGIMAGKVTVRDGVEWFDYIMLSNQDTQSDCAIQVHNVIYIVATPTSPGGNFMWDGSLLTADPDGPRGSAGVFFKGRLWITPGAYASSYPSNSQLRFSDPISLTGTPDPVWNPVNNIPVGQGDGQRLIDLAVANDNLMLFKNNSTYVYMFDVSPNEGILRKINTTIGTSAQFCVVSHENEVYTYHEGKLYQISNNNFIDTTIKVPFKSLSVPDAQREKVCVSLLGDIIVVRYFKSLYALNLTTKTWTTWSSSNSVLNSIGRIHKLESNIISTSAEHYFAGSVTTGSKSIMVLRAEHTSSDVESYVSNTVFDGSGNPVSATLTPVSIECKIVTKIYDFGTPHLFKRLMWWGVDAISDGRIIANAKPARQTLPVTWDALSEFTWEQLYTWDQLLEETAATETDFNDPYVIRRKFIKLLKSLRFRRISFSVRFFSDGKTSSEQTLGPSRVFSISAIVGAKQTVVKQVE